MGWRIGSGGPEIDFDNPDGKIDVGKLAEAYSYREKLTKAERLKLMWKPDGFEGVSSCSPELAEVTSVATGSMGVGFIYGSVTCGSAAIIAFKEQNKQTMFLHPREAQKLVTQQALFHMTRGGTIFALRYGLFSFTYMATAQSLGVAYNRVNPGDHMIAGCLTGALYRLPSGWRPAVASGVLGSAMGLVVGVGFWIAHIIRGDDVGARWVDRFEREQKLFNDIRERKRQELQESGQARPVDCVETRGLENVEGQSSGPPSATIELATDTPAWNEDEYVWNRVVNRIRGFMGGAANPNPDYIPDKWDKAPEDMKEHDWMFKKAKK